MNELRIYRVPAAIITAAAILLIPATAGAVDYSQDPNYFTLQSPEVHSVSQEVGSETASPAAPEGAPSPHIGAAVLGQGGGGGPASAIGGAVQIVNVGLQIWKLVQDNAPVTTLNSTGATAVPAGSRWEDLAGWGAPRQSTYEVVYRNLYNMAVADFTYSVTYTPGGQYRGRGDYLADVRVVVDHLSVLWGFKFDASAQVPTVVNLGTTAAPVAGAQILVQWTIKTLFRNVTESRQYLATGAGELRDLFDNPNSDQLP